jgi:hypothetical protein
MAIAYRLGPLVVQLRYEIIDRTNSSTVLQAIFSSERPSLRALISALRA